MTQPVNDKSAVDGDHAEDSVPARFARQLLAAQEAERKRIAAELHDSVGQQLSAIRFTLDDVRQRLDDRLTPLERRDLAQLAARISATIEETRRISHALRPPMLDDFGVIHAVEWLCKELSRVCPGVVVTCDIRAEEDAIPTRIKNEIFRILQEACNNACKHAAARHLAIRLHTDAEGIRLVVADDGVGFDLAASNYNPLCLGLRSMRERAVQTGGELVISAAAGAGTRVLAQWPARGPD